MLKHVSFGRGLREYSIELSELQGVEALGKNRTKRKNWNQNLLRKDDFQTPPALKAIFGLLIQNQAKLHPKTGLQLSDQKFFQAQRANCGGLCNGFSFLLSF